MESQPQNAEFRINPENFHPCKSTLLTLEATITTVSDKSQQIYAADNKSTTLFPFIRQKS